MTSVNKKMVYWWKGGIIKTQAYRLPEWCLLLLLISVVSPGELSAKGAALKPAVLMAMATPSRLSGNRHALHVVTDGPLQVTGQAPQAGWQTDCSRIDTNQSQHWVCTGAVGNMAFIHLAPEGTPKLELKVSEGQTVVVEHQSEAEKMLWQNRSPLKHFADQQANIRSITEKTNRRDKMLWRISKRTTEDREQIYRLYLQKHTGISVQDQTEIQQEIKRGRTDYYRILQPLNPPGHDNEMTAGCDPVLLPDTRWCSARTEEACQPVYDSILIATGNEMGKKQSITQASGSRDAADEKDESLTCKHCGLNCKRKSALIVHLRIHTGETPYRCEICGKAFKQKGGLKVHNRIHSGEKPYKCEDCNRQFNVRSSLIRHVRTHTGERPYKCDICGKEFCHKNAMKDHRHVHEEERLYKCDICGKAFKRNYSVKIHQAVHSDERPYKCDICGLTYKYRQKLKEHLKRHPVESPCQCMLCGERFNFRCSLKSHKCIDNTVENRDVHEEEINREVHEGDEIWMELMAILTENSGEAGSDSSSQRK